MEWSILIVIYVNLFLRRKKKYDLVIKEDNLIGYRRAIPYFMAKGWLKLE